MNPGMLEAEMQPYMDSWYRSKNLIPDRSVACKEYDLIVTNLKGEKITIEEKFRNRIETDDLLIELIQDVETYDIGWAYKTQCDRLCYCFCNNKPQLIVRLKWKEFWSWQKNQWRVSRKRIVRFSSKGSGLTLNIEVIISSIPREFIQCYRP